MLLPAAPIPFSLTALGAALATGLAVALVATPSLRRLAIRLHIVDHPDERKVHRQPIPYLGGVALFLGITLGLVAAYVAGAAANRDLWAWLGAGMLTIHITGLVDDVKGVNPTTKIAGQLVAAATLANLPGANLLAQDVLRVLGMHDPLPHFAVQMSAAAGATVLVLGATNAMNLIDGLDGLCASIAAIGHLGFAAIAVSVLDRNPHDASAQLALLLATASFGATLGYLKWNWHPAKIFMGDAGSLMLGYLVAAQIILLSTSAPSGQNGLCFLQGLGAVMVFGVPIADTALAFFRRKMHGKPLFSPDALHLHHLLRRRFSVRQTVVILTGCAVLAALAGIAVTTGWPSRMAAFGVAFGGLALAMALGYRAASKMER